MASNDTAALVLYLARQLTKFEDDMKPARIMADKNTKDIERRFTALNGAIEKWLFEVRLGNRHGR